MKILFCNIAWMKLYQGVSEDDVPRNGGKYIAENQFGNEENNFLDYNHRCYGFVMTYGNLNLDKHYQEITKQESQVDGFTIIWCASNDDGGSRIVGWYKNATVYREQQNLRLYTDEGGDLCFNFVADVQDCYLLPEEQRTFKIERAAVAGKGNGFGQSNVWYAESAYAQNELIPRVLQYIEAHEDDTICFWMTNEDINGMIDNEEFEADYQILFEKGLDCCNEEDPDYFMALKYFNTARTVKETPVVLFNLGYVLLLFRCFDEAIPLFKKCIEFGYETTEATQNLVYAYDASFNREKTLAYCKKLIPLLEAPENEDELDYRIIYCSAMCEIYADFSEFTKATAMAKQILTYSDDEDTQEHVRNLLSYIKELQEEQQL